MKRYIHKTQNKLHLKKRILKVLSFLLVAIAIGLLAERLITKGTFLGYQVIRKETSQTRRNKNISGSEINTKHTKTSDTKACKSISKETLSKKLSDDLRVVGSFVPDKDGPISTSSCIFVSDSSKLTISILLREFQDQSKIKTQLDNVMKNEKVELLNAIGDHAVYNNSANQLTVQFGKRLYTITVTKNTEEKFDNKRTALGVVDSLQK